MKLRLMLIITMLIYSGCNPKSDISKNFPKNYQTPNPDTPVEISDVIVTVHKPKQTVIKQGKDASPTSDDTQNVSQPEIPDKIYEQLRHAGINNKTVSFFFNPKAKYRLLMQEKLLNSRDPHHLHVVWQELKNILSSKRWKTGFEETLVCLWEASENDFRKQILDSLLLNEKLHRTGRTPWLAGNWLLTQNIAIMYDLYLTKALKKSQHPARQWVRDYLTVRHKLNYGSNYLIWSRYLEQRLTEQVDH